MTTKIIIQKNKWDFNRNHKAQLWNFSPRFPIPDAAALERVLAKIYENTNEDGYLLFWMPAAQLHRVSFDPVRMVGEWVPIGTLLSGVNPIYVGYAYVRRRRPGLDFGCKLILDVEGRAGVSSSLTAKWVLERFCEHGGPVFDPYAHSSAQLAQWCRRLGIGYRGHIDSKKNREVARKILAQIELPAVQMDISFIEKGNQYGKEEKAEGRDPSTEGE